MAWDAQHMTTIVAGIGDAVDVDDDVEELWKMDRARILIKTPWSALIQHTVTVHIQGEEFMVHIIEETGAYSNTCRCRRGIEYSSSEDILSEESELGASCMMGVSEEMAVQIGSSEEEMVRAIAIHKAPMEKTRARGDLLEMALAAQKGSPETKAVRSRELEMVTDEEAEIGSDEAELERLLSSECAKHHDPVDNTYDTERSTCILTTGGVNQTAETARGNAGGVVTVLPDLGEEIENGSTTAPLAVDIHKNGRVHAEETVEVLEPFLKQSEVARVKEGAEICGLGFTPHTPINPKVQLQQSFLKIQAEKTPIINVYSKKRWRKKQTEPKSPDRYLLKHVDQQGSPPNQDKKRGDNLYAKQQQKEDVYNTSVELKQHNNIDKEAERLWQLAQEMGIAYPKEQTSQVQRLVHMEERDIMET